MSKKPIEEQTATELVEYIRTSLRPELQERRETAERYESAFAKFKDPEQRGLLHMIRQFADDRERGAQLFRELSNTILPPETTNQPTEQEEPMSEETPEEAPPADDKWATEKPPKWAVDLQEEISAMRQERVAVAENENQAAINDLKATARGFGLVEDSPEWSKFFSIASSDLANGDLDVAKGIYEKLEGPIVSDSAATEEAPPAEEKPSFPKTGGAGGDSPGAAAPDGPEIDFSSKRAVNEAAAAYIDSLGSDNAIVP